MKPRFKNLRELKQQLPEVLTRIKTCRKYAEIERYLMHEGMKERVNWLSSSSVSSWYETDAALSEAYKNSILYDMEADWLQSQVDRLKERPTL